MLALDFVTMGANCAPLEAGLICYFVASLSGAGQADIIAAFGSTSGYLDVLSILTDLTLKAW